MRWNTSPRWDISPEWDTFHSAFTWEKYPIRVGYFSSKLNKQSCLGGTAWQKLFTWRKMILSKWDLTFVGVKSQPGGMNPFSYKRFAFPKWNTPFCRDVTQVKYLTWMGWFFSYKRLLIHITTLQRLNVELKKSKYVSISTKYRWILLSDW